MLTIKSLTAETYDIDSITLKWEIEPTSEDLEHYYVNIYRSESPGISGLEQFDIIASGIPVEDYMYNDTSIENLYDHSRT